MGGEGLVLAARSASRLLPEPSTNRQWGCGAPQGPAAPLPMVWGGSGQAPAQEVGLQKDPNSRSSRGRHVCQERFLLGPPK